VLYLWIRRKNSKSEVLYAVSRLPFTAYLTSLLAATSRTHISYPNHRVIWNKIPATEGTSDAGMTTISDFQERLLSRERKKQNHIKQRTLAHVDGENEGSLTKITKIIPWVTKLLLNLSKKFQHQIKISHVKLPNNNGNVSRQISR